MPSIVLYLLKCSMSLGIVWLFYQLLLRRLTFYAMNRWYLPGYAVLSFLLPLIHIALPDEAVVVGKIQVMNYIPAIGPDVISFERARQILPNPCLLLMKLNLLNRRWRS